jgi:hypothetical protein
MIKWKIFNKSKDEKIQEETQVEPETVTVKEEPPLTEYNETLYSKDTKQKEKIKTQKTKNPPANQRVWRDVDAIEENIDNLEKKPKTKRFSDSNIQSSVDRIISKRKK